MKDVKDVKMLEGQVLEDVKTLGVTATLVHDLALEATYDGLLDPNTVAAWLRAKHPQEWDMHARWNNEALCFCPVEEYLIAHGAPDNIQLGFTDETLKRAIIVHRRGRDGGDKPKSAFAPKWVGIFMNMARDQRDLKAEAAAKMVLEAGKLANAFGGDKS